MPTYNNLLPNRNNIFKKYVAFIYKVLLDYFICSDPVVNVWNNREQRNGSFSNEFNNLVGKTENKGCFFEVFCFLGCYFRWPTFFLE